MVDKYPEIGTDSDLQSPGGLPPVSSPRVRELQQPRVSRVGDQEHERFCGGTQEAEGGAEE
eukprot:26058-Eustigmatos_ZCMA.PRE.1